MTAASACNDGSVHSHAVTVGGPNLSVSRSFVSRTVSRAIWEEGHRRS